MAVLDASDPARPTLERTLAAPFLAHDVGFAPDGRTVRLVALGLLEAASGLMMRPTAPRRNDDDG